MSIPPLDNVSAVILSAGLGNRMSGPHPKLLLPWRAGKPILWHTVQGALSLGLSDVVVVVRPDLPAIRSALEDLPVRTVSNPRYREGMSTSLQAGIHALPGNVEAALILLGDEPDGVSDIAKALLRAYSAERKPVTAPFYGAQSGPPVLFSRAAFPLLLELKGDTGARHLISRYPELVTRVTFTEADRPPDIDTVEDYKGRVTEGNRAPE